MIVADDDDDDGKTNVVMQSPDGPAEVIVQIYRFSRLQFVSLINRTLFLLGVLDVRFLSLRTEDWRFRRRSRETDVSRIAKTKPNKHD